MADVGPLRRGGPEHILILEHPEETWVGRSLQEVSTQMRLQPAETAIVLQLKGDRKRRGGARLRAFSMSALQTPSGN